VVTSVLMSVKERFAEAILGQSKRYELRRVRPRIAPGATVWLYATKPRGAVVGRFEAGEILSSSPAELWRAIGPHTGVTRKEFMAYFSGCDVAHAIEVKRPIRTDPQPLPDAGRAPQSYRFLTGGEVAGLATG